MSKKHIVLIAGVSLGVVSIALIMIKGNPENQANFSSVMQVAESVIYDADKAIKLASRVSDATEIAAGIKIHEKLLSMHLARNIETTEVQKYLNDVGKKVAQNVKRKNIPYKFHIIDSYLPNAFASPGGHVYVTIGLLEKLRTEAELAGILGHEITHIDARHAIENIQHKLKTEKTIDVDVKSITDIGYQTLFRPAYSEIQEDEADIGGVYLAYEARYHPMAVIAAFKNVNKRELEQGAATTSV
ncbi:MAG: M48 family metalloprotease, partial [Candidatus Omnitrophica bacterium]|nr:M48 family metalloprotease [Candidatus Omnitrophota bacterium]